MKKVSVIVLALMVLLLVPATVCAQSDGISFNVPFRFGIADKQMPAGKYQVTALYWNAVSLVCAESKTGVVALGQPTTQPAGAQPKLIFHKYGNHYFLAEVRLLNMHSGRKLYQSKEETEIATGNSTPEMVEVAAK